MGTLLKRHHLRELAKNVLSLIWGHIHRGNYQAERPYKNMLLTFGFYLLINFIFTNGKWRGVKSKNKNSLRDKFSYSHTSLTQMVLFHKVTEGYTFWTSDKHFGSNTLTPLVSLWLNQHIIHDKYCITMFAINVNKSHSITAPRY